MMSVHLELAKSLGAGRARARRDRSGVGFIHVERDYAALSVGEKLLARAVDGRCVSNACERASTTSTFIIICLPNAPSGSIVVGTNAFAAPSPKISRRDDFPGGKYANTHSAITNVKRTNQTHAVIHQTRAATPPHP